MLHYAVNEGSIKGTKAVLQEGSVDVDQGTPKGRTPLMLAASKGYTRIIRLLLDRGADLTIANEIGDTALHNSADHGHVPATKMLMKAGADLEAANIGGATPLHLAAHEGQAEVMSALIEAGANVDSRGPAGATPMFFAAQNGHVGAIRELLRAKADPLLATAHLVGADTTDIVPLDVAAEEGHLDVVRHLVQNLGIEACGGAGYGSQALCLAAQQQRVDVMAVLMGAGVVDTGKSLARAARFGREPSVKYLLQQRNRETTGDDAYVNTRDAPYGETPLLLAVGFRGCCSPRIVRLLVDAGADTTSAVQVTLEGGLVLFHDTPLAVTSRSIRDKTVLGKHATEDQLNRLEATRRLLLRVDAALAVSWLWPCGMSSITHAFTRNKVTSTCATPLGRMIPALRRRARRRVLLSLLFRWVMTLRLWYCFHRKFEGISLLTARFGLVTQISGYACRFAVGADYFRCHRRCCCLVAPFVIWSSDELA